LRAVSTYEWLLFLHLLLAVLLVGGIVGFGFAGLSAAEGVRRVLARPSLILWNVGGLGVLVFGIALAIERPEYDPWDGWIIAAIVLWLVASAAGGRMSRFVSESYVRGDAPPLTVDRARLLLAVMAGTTLLLLIDMIFKPGA